MKGIGMETTKLKYEAPELEMLLFGRQDVIRTSDDGQDDFFGDDW